MLFWRTVFEVFLSTSLLSSATSISNVDKFACTNDRHETGMNSTISAPSPATLTETLEYGFDVSWPIKRYNVSENYSWLAHNVNPNNTSTPNEFKGVPVQPLGDRQKVYNDFMKGCYEAYDHDACDAIEDQRVDSNLNDAYMRKNFTSTGFKKVQAPQHMFRLLRDFWEKNRDRQELETFEPGYTFTNHWESPCFFVRIEDMDNFGGGRLLRRKLSREVKKMIEDWTRQKLRTTSIYGIRVYKEGAILTPHVDRESLISSAIINVDQDVDEEWPLEVYDRDGNAFNVTMKPGEMVLYESHTLIHGRPFAMKGRYFANIFLHFEPQYDENVDDEFDDPGTTDAHLAAREGNINELIMISKENEKMLNQRDENGWTPLHECARSGYKDVIEFLLDHGADLNATTDGKWSVLDCATNSLGKHHPITKFLIEKGAVSITQLMFGSTRAHLAARDGDLDELIRIAGEDESLLHQKDFNGWTPIHEAVRGGSVEAINFLLGKGLHVNEKSEFGNGYTALSYAKKFWGDNHLVAKFLEIMGGKE